MSEFVFILPDLGEGTVEAEILEWYVVVGDEVAEGAPMADVMTDKANVEVPAPVTGKVVSLGGAIGDVVPVGAPLITFAVASDSTPELEPSPAKTAAPLSAAPTAAPASEVDSKDRTEAAEPADKLADTPRVAKKSVTTGGKVITSPAIRKHAAEVGVDLAHIQGSGPRGRILRRDLEQHLSQAATSASAPSNQAIPNTTSSAPVEEIKIRGVRRVIAQRLSASKRDIPHFTYVEEVDVTALDALRHSLNQTHAEPAGIPSLTYLPLVSLALIQALRAHPLCNARYLGETETLERYEAVHLGIATQTDAGLKVPVVHDAQTESLWGLAQRIREVTNAARDGSAARDSLSGSTITITSLGKLGGIVSTPVINAPEVAIVGLNKAVPRPVVQDGAVVVRTMMNISGSFDHRIIDGFDAASFIDTLKTLLEQPGLIFIAKP
jgi:2-oxoisovalerate dehydrogenase E2 component (dihydrolipoyl transacylase)